MLWTVEWFISFHLCSIATMWWSFSSVVHGILSFWTPWNTVTRFRALHTVQAVPVRYLYWLTHCYLTVIVTSNLFFFSCSEFTTEFYVEIVLAYFTCMGTAGESQGTQNLSVIQCGNEPLSGIALWRKRFDLNWLRLESVKRMTLHFLIFTLIMKLRISIQQQEDFFSVAD